MKFFLVAFSVLFVLLFSSCQRELDIDPGNPPPSGNDSTILWKYAEIDTTLPAGLDTSQIVFFEYDNQGRISKMLDYSRSDTSSSPAFTYTTESSYYYSGNDPLPFKVIVIANDLDMPAHVEDTIYYSYKDGLVTYDSSRYYGTNPFATYSSLAVRTFNTIGNTTTGTEKLIDLTNLLAPICASNVTYIKTYSNGNIINENGSMTGCTTGSWNSQFSYDTKINPFYKIQIPYPHAMNFIEFQGAQKNNVTETTISGFQTKYFYQYNSNGYPSVVRINDIPVTYSYKVVFFYKN